jgi:hypothetical protein
VRDPDAVFSRVDKQAKELARARHETVNGRLKIFRVLSIMFWHIHNLHQFFFHAVAVLTHNNKHILLYLRFLKTIVFELVQTER